MDYNKHCKYELGQYVQVHDQHDNTMLPRTTGALALRPTGNAQGNFYFFSLSTGRVLNRVHATPLPIPDDVIKRVETLACRQRVNSGLVFGDREQQPINDLDDYYYDEADDADYDTDDEEQDDSEFDEDYEYASEDDEEEYNKALRMRMAGKLLLMWQFQNQPSQRWMNPILGTQTRYTMTNI